MDPKNIWAERVLWRFPSEILIFPKAQNTCLLGVACIFFFLFETIKIRVALVLGPRCPGLFCQVILQVRLMMILFTMNSPVKTFPLVLISAEGRKGRQKSLITCTHITKWRITRTWQRMQRVLRPSLRAGRPAHLTRSISQLPCRQNAFALCAHCCGTEGTRALAPCRERDARATGLCHCVCLTGSGRTSVVDPSVSRGYLEVNE